MINYFKQQFKLYISSTFFVGEFYLQFFYEHIKHEKNEKLKQPISSCVYFIKPTEIFLYILNRPIVLVFLSAW